MSAGACAYGIDLGGTELRVALVPRAQLRESELVRRARLIHLQAW